MSGRKRRLPTEDTSEPPSKAKRHTIQDEQVITVDDDEEESLESILAKIKAQEEGEALARKLQQEWAGATNSAGSSAAAARVNDKEVIDLCDEEDDEALARRLAMEWEAADADPQNSGSGSGSKGKRKASAAEEDDHNLTPDKRLERYRELFTGTRQCKCGAELPSPRGFVAYSTQVPPPSLLALLHAPCKSCKANHCRGCLAEVSCPLSCKGKGKSGSDTCPVMTCCAEVRAIALFEALGGFDRQYLGERATSDSRAKVAAAKYRGTHVASIGPGGTGYGTGPQHSYNYDYLPRSRGRGRGRGRGALVDSTSRVDQFATHWDQIVVRALTTITQFLPSQYSDAVQIYDMLPHASTEALLSLSQLPDLLGDLLRNDSVTDWIARIEVYHAVLTLLRRMADCELTIEVLIGHRWELDKSCGLEEWMWGDGEIFWEKDKDGQLVKDPPLYEHFKKLTKQCETFLAGASSMFEDSAGDNQDADDAGDVTETMVKAASLCGDIIAARDDVERAMAVLGKDPSALVKQPEPEAPKRRKGKAPDPAIVLERTYARAFERLAFRYASLSQPAPGGGLGYPTYNYAADLARTASSTRNPKDRLHLIKELAVMATSLPVGVWVRVDEVRNDAIKIMIAGPEGTPYAGGLFEFDCCIPLNYPNSPPLMHLRTTGGGRVRFNPNLYNCGKVCLSLLGTWPGRPEEQWSPRSTLLQVVVSIQSMILIDLPYFNEPGYGQANPDNGQSIAYNRNITMQTVRWAMVEWMKDEHKHGIWADIIASHFTIRHEMIRKCITQWAKVEPQIRRYAAGSTAELYGGLAPMQVAPPMYTATTAPPTYTATSAPQHRPPAQHTIDLLEEFDQGIARVQAWQTQNSEHDAVVPAQAEP